MSFINGQSATKVIQILWSPSWTSCAGFNFYSNCAVQWTSCQDTFYARAVLRFSHVKNKNHRRVENYNLNTLSARAQRVCACVRAFGSALLLEAPVVAYVHEPVIPPCLPSRGIQSLRVWVCLQTWQQQRVLTKACFFFFCFFLAAGLQNGRDENRMSCMCSAAQVRWRILKKINKLNTLRQGHELKVVRANDSI